MNNKTEKALLRLDDEVSQLRAINAELLAALEEIKRCNEQYNFGSKLLRIVLPAIAKAQS